MSQTDTASSHSKDSFASALLTLAAEPQIQSTFTLTYVTTALPLRVVHSLVNFLPVLNEAFNYPLGQSLYLE